MGIILPTLSFTVASAKSDSSVYVRLFATRSFRAISLQGYSGLRVSGLRAYGTVTLRAKGLHVQVTDEKSLRLAQPVVTVASRSGRWVDLQLPSASKRTVGWLRITVRHGELQVVNVLPLETYVLGIVNAELGSLDFHPESLKAQIVASRSYVLASRDRHRRDGYDFCDSPHCQAFGGTASIQSAFKLAMEVSRGEYLSYASRPVPAFFHDNCGGRTASVEEVWDTPSLPCLQGVRDGPQDPYCRHAPRAHWHFIADRKALRECFHREGWISDYDALDSLRVVTTGPSGRAQQVCIQSNHPLWVSANDFRQALGRFYGSEVLPSTLFSMNREQDHFHFVGRGWGHGVGLCQWGAIQMAKEGKTYREILQHYYPGTQIDRLPEPLYATSNKGGSLFN